MNCLPSSRRGLLRARTSQCANHRTAPARSVRNARPLPFVARATRDSINAACVETVAQSLEHALRQAPHVARHTPQPFSHEQEIDRLQNLLQLLQAAGSTAAQVELLWSHPVVVSEFMSSGHMQEVAAIVQGLPLEEQSVLCCAVAIGQGHLLKVQCTGSTTAALRALASSLQRVDHFYDSMGGLLGYQLRSLQLILAGLATSTLQGSQPAAAQQLQDGTLAGTSTQQREDVVYHVPRGLDLAGEGGPAPGLAAAVAGLLALPHTAEIYPVGGAGDRLGLLCDITGECLPAAMLPYCGRPLLESLLRDLQAREHLFFRLTGRQTVTPVAVMTSDAKGNHARIVALLEGNNWFGRGREAFKLFRQPLVPVLAAEDGQWLMSGAFEPQTKPGGHGAIWKLMHDEGVFDWLLSAGREAGIVRQISNPIAGTDTTLLALAGEGVQRGAALGFMSCERAVGAAEGMNVLQERRQWVEGPAGGRWEYHYGVTNVEYTEFERLGISDEAAGEGSATSVFPANTNILYVGLAAVKAVVEAAVASGGDSVLPGLIFNLKKQVTYRDPVTNTERRLTAGRMECTMQNLADSLTDPSPTPLDPAALPPLSTFLVNNLRRKVTSSAKKRRTPGSAKIAQTPDGSFFDLMRNAWQLLQMCGLQHVPELGSVQDYLTRGPSFIFLYHPALGPLWDVIAQKVRGGRLEAGSELVLEVAEARLVDLQLQGSLLITATNPMGHFQGPPTPPTPSPATGAGAASPMRSFSFLTAPNGQEAGSELVVHGLPLQGGAGGGGAAVSSGRAAGEQLVYSDGCGRVNLENVRVVNRGVDWEAPGTVFWKHQVERKESLQIVLHGRAEFDARDVTLFGSWTFEVPDGHRMVVTTAPAGGVQKWLFPLQAEHPSWWWDYAVGADGASVEVSYQRGYEMELFPSPLAEHEQFVLDWVI